MAPGQLSVFDLVVPETDEHPSFKALRTAPMSIAARWAVDQAFGSFHDADGNFLQQLQSTGFDARFFELYLHAYFQYTGFTEDRKYTKPDFIVSCPAGTAAVEATTVNPSTSGVLAQLGKKISDLTRPEIFEYQRHELALRFGSPLFSKLQKRYWEQEHCNGIPLVLAIEAFHDEQSLSFADSALTSYLFGIKHEAEWDQEGKLRIEFDRIYEHVLGKKVVPSSFFDQPDTEYISAVMFTNSGTTAKFSRMGYQCGVGNDVLEMVRAGYCLNTDRDARDPTLFRYSLDNPPFAEPWGQGLVVIHNPKALRPLPHNFFPHSVQMVLKPEGPTSLTASWHPFTSKTMVFHLGELKLKLKEASIGLTNQIAVGAITKAEFRGVTGIPEPPGLREEGWFCDDAQCFLGVLVFDIKDSDWGYIILARDLAFQFRAIDMASSFATRTEAHEKLVFAISSLVDKPQRLFPQ